MTLEELKQIKEKMQGPLGLDNSGGMRVVVGMATCGIASGAKPVLQAIADEVKAKNLDNVSVLQTGCIGLCQYEPIVEIVEPGKEKVTYIKMTPDKAKRVVEEHIAGGKPIPEFTLATENV